MAMGEAAGLAASLALNSEQDPADISFNALTTALVDQDVLLEPIPVEISELTNG
jgi:hypothetical protein